MDIKRLNPLLFNVKEKSVAKKRKVGAIVFDDKTNEVFSTGYNYNFDDICENKSNETLDTVIHAEESAILQLIQQPNADIINNENLSIFVSYSPCINCCRLIVQAGIKKLYYVEEHSKNFRTCVVEGSLSPLEYLTSQNVKVFKYNFNTLSFVNQNFITAIVYHSVDVDGFMSAWLMEKVLKFNDKPYILYPYNYEEKSEWMSDLNIKDFIFVDITPPVDWLNRFIKSNELMYTKSNIKIYDHHTKRIQDINNYIKCTTLFINTKIEIFDTNLDNPNYCDYHDCFINIDNQKYRSASYIVYANHIKLFDENIVTNTLSRIKKLINTISYYDTWGWKSLDKYYKKEILDIMGYLNSISFESFNDLLNQIDMLSENLDEIKQKGFTINEYIKQETINNIVHSNCVKIDLTNNMDCFKINFPNNRLNFVLFNGIPNFHTEDIIRNHYNIGKDEYLCYFCMNISFDKNNDTKIKCSVRTSAPIIKDSIIDDIGISAYKIAKLLDVNGGGHINAAGSCLDKEKTILLQFNFKTFVENIIKELYIKNKK